MALIKLTAIVDNISGKLNGSVFARNKGGHYVRSKSNPTNPRTGIQSSARAAFASIAAAWRGLTGAQRSAWNGATNDFPYQNKLGDTKTLSGFSLHQKLNRNLQLVGAAALTVPNSPVNTAAPTDMTLVNGGVGELTLQGDLNADTAAGALLVYATPAISPGINNFTNRLRLIGQLAHGGFTTGTDIATMYTNKYGALPIGAKIGVQVVNISTATGQASAPAVASVVVTQ